MKKKQLLFFLLVITSFSFAQKTNEVRASMGIDFISSPSLKTYLESNFTDQLSSFVSAVNFSGSYGRMISSVDQVEIELGYLINSFNSQAIDGIYNLDYSIVMPSVLYYYVVSGNGYNFKFGGGAGVRFLSATEKLPADANNYNYSTTGFGLILRAAGNTAISQDVYAYISADMRYDQLKEPAPSNESNVLGNVNFNSLSFGVKLGISYQF